jgi:hypothetical protein
VDAATRWRRSLRLTGALLGAAACSLRRPMSTAKGRQRLAVCAAARVLTAAGVRVEVHSSPVAWPRAAPGHGPGQLVVANRVCWVDALALRTVVRGAPVVGPDVVGRAQTGAPVCPVAVRYRVEGTAAGRTLAGHLAAGPLWRGVARVVATRDVVVEVHLLPALPAAGASARELAALAEYAVADVVRA